MKKFFYFVAVIAFVFSLSVSYAFAAGGKVHGEKGQGSVVQNCIMPDGCPWED